MDNLKKGYINGYHPLNKQAGIVEDFMVEPVPPRHRRHLAQQPGLGLSYPKKMGQGTAAVRAGSCDLFKGFGRRASPHAGCAKKHRLRAVANGEEAINKG